MKKYNCLMVAEESGEDLLFSSPDEVANFCRDKLYMHQSPQELVYVFDLNGKQKIVGYELVSKGTLCGSFAEPRDIYRGAIVNNAASVILTHCHPSGEISPSAQDDEVTKRISEVGKLLGIPLLDHLIIGNPEYFSYKETGQIQ